MQATGKETIKRVKTADLEDEAVKNTLNSFINNEQIKQINNDGFKKALLIKKNYQLSKRTYEINLLKNTQNLITENQI